MLLWGCWEEQEAAPAQRDGARSRRPGLGRTSSEARGQQQQQLVRIWGSGALTRRCRHESVTAAWLWWGQDQGRVVTSAGANSNMGCGCSYRGLLGATTQQVAPAGSSRLRRGQGQRHSSSMLVKALTAPSGSRAGAVGRGPGRCSGHLSRSSCMGLRSDGVAALSRGQAGAVLGRETAAAACRSQCWLQHGRRRSRGGGVLLASAEVVGAVYRASGW